MFLIDLWQCDRKERAVRVFPMNDAYEFVKLVGMVSLEVVVLMDVCREVVEERLALAHNQFPVTLPYANDLCAAVAHLPIKEFVLALLARLAKHGRAEGDAIKQTYGLPRPLQRRGER